VVVVFWWLECVRYPVASAISLIDHHSNGSYGSSKSLHEEPRKNWTLLQKKLIISPMLRQGGDEATVIGHHFSGIANTA